MMVFLLVASVFFAIGLVRVGVFGRVGHDARPELFAYVGAFRVSLLGGTKGKKKATHKKTEQEKAARDKKTSSKLNARDMVEPAMSLVRHVLRSVRVGWLRADITIGGKRDAAHAAVLYGRAWMLAGIITPLLEQNNNVQRYAYTIDLDFNQEKTTGYAELDISFSIGALFGIALYAAWLWLRLKKPTQKGEIAYGKAGS